MKVSNAVRCNVLVFWKVLEESSSVVQRRTMPVS